jgi:hypothetical protein
MDAYGGGEQPFQENVKPPNVRDFVGENIS